MIQLPRTLLNDIRRHAEGAYPDECCGALLGREEPHARVIHDVVTVDNRRVGTAAQRRFLMTAEDLRIIERNAGSRSLDVVGFYHSHPDHPARPSDYDREHALPWYSYVIVSVKGGAARHVTSWKLQEDRSAFSSEEIA